MTIMKNIYRYPALFERDETGYTVPFPDLAGCWTEGADVDDADEKR